MSLHGPSRVGKHIAPASDLIIDEDNKLRISFVDVFKNKRPHLLKWRRFQKRKEFLLPSHCIQRFAETRDMILGYRPDFINHDAFL